VTGSQTGQNSAYAIQVDQDEQDQTTQTLTGNAVSGDVSYVSLHGEHSSTLTQTDTFNDGSGEQTKTTTLTGTNDLEGTGNQISGDYTRTQTLADTASVHEEGTRAGADYTLDDASDGSIDLLGGAGLQRSLGAEEFVADLGTRLRAGAHSGNYNSPSPLAPIPFPIRAARATGTPFCWICIFAGADNGRTQVSAAAPESRPRDRPLDSSPWRERIP
jgi:hypothetical protein